MAERHQFFYFIVDRPESRNPEYLLKIGTSNNVKETRTDIEKNRENDLRTYAVYAHDDVRVLEKFAQEHLASRELKRGWYKIKKADLDALIEDMKLIEGIKHTTESKARVSSRSRKPKEQVGAADADAASDEEPAPPKPSKPAVVEQPRAPEPLKTLKNTKPSAFPTQAPAAAVTREDRGKKLIDEATRETPVNKDKALKAFFGDAAAESSKPKPRPATPARKERSSKPKKRTDEGVDHSLDWD